MTSKTVLIGAGTAGAVALGAFLLLRQSKEKSSERVSTEKKKSGKPKREGTHLLTNGASSGAWLVETRVAARSHLLPVPAQRTR
jgi:hypothetical protein